ncbi:MAG: ABC transporter substrate-binding protein [Micrococcales bacterium]|nr:ABC transporter substrate-binding protein [Micrococcales bacterium]
MRTVCRHFLPLAAITAAAALALAGCGGGGTDETPGAQPEEVGKVELVHAGQLTACVYPYFAPYNFVEDGEIKGFDPALMGELAKDLDLTLFMRETPFEAIESAVALDMEDCDIASSSITITEGRRAKADFSEPYYYSTMGMLVSEASGIDSIDSLAGKTIGVQQGTTGEKWAKLNLDPNSLLTYESVPDQATALAAGEVDGIVNDVPTLEPYVTDSAHIMTALAEAEEFGFMVKKGNTALLNAVNRTLERVHQDGTYDQLMTQWITAASNSE